MVAPARTRRVALESNNWFFRTPGDCGPFALAREDRGDGTLYRKELAYPGHFVKKDDYGNVEFELTIRQKDLHHWVRTFDEMKNDGVKVPLPIGHVTHPEARRGTIERMAVEPSDTPGPRYGQPALFCYTRFHSRKIAAALSNSDVSLFMPPRAHNGFGKTYKRPIRHVAITDYPVIPALGKFKPIAAGFEFALDDSSQEGAEMDEEPLTWAKVAETLGVELPPDADEAAAEAAVTEAWGGEHPSGEHADTETLDDPTAGGDEGFEEEGAEDEHADYPSDMQDPMEPERRRKKGPSQPIEEDEPSPMSLSHAPSPAVVKLVTNGRKAQLDALRPKLTAPAYKALRDKYVTPRAVGFALSMEELGENADDFDFVCASLSLLPDIRTGEQTKVQEVPDDQNPLLRDAEKKAAAAKASRR